MKLVEKMLLLKQRTTAATPVTWSSYLTSLALPAWWRMRDTSGVTVVNSGSLGSAVDLTATAWTMNQAGQLGSGEAGLADGATTVLTCANNATLAGYSPWEAFFLVRPSSAGEGSLGAFFMYGNAAPGPYGLFFHTIDSLKFSVWNTLGSEFSSITTTGLTALTWCILFAAYGTDKKIHIRKGISGGVSEFAYTAQDTLTGTYDVPTTAFNLLNATAQSRTFAGLVDEVGWIGGRTFTDAERLQMTVLAGV